MRRPHPALRLLVLCTSAVRLCSQPVSAQSKYKGFAPFTKPEPLQWPSLAAISYKYEGDESFSYEAMGVLVSPRHVLTAGYNVNNNWYRYADVRLGYSKNLSHWLIAMHVPYDNVIHHPTYSARDVDAGVNLALIRLPVSALFAGTRIALAPISSHGTKPTKDLVGASVVLPWMRRAPSEATYRLVATRINIVSQSDALASGLNPSRVREEFLYSRNTGLPAECVSKSEWVQRGSNESFKLTGPLFKINADGDQTLSGVYFSRPNDSMECGVHIFTRVDPFMSWIRNHKEV